MKMLGNEFNNNFRQRSKCPTPYRRKEHGSCYWVLTNMTTPRPHKTKAILEHELSEIYHLLDDGIASQEIKCYLAERDYTGYRQHLRDQQNKRQEYFLVDLAIAKERLLADMRQLQAIITNPNTSTMVKLRAAKADFHLNIALLKLEYECLLFVEDYRKRKGGNASKVQEGS